MVCERTKIILNMDTLSGLTTSQLMERGEHSSAIPRTNRYRLCDGTIIETTPTGLELAMAWRCRECKLTASPSGVKRR